MRARRPRAVAGAEVPHPRLWRLGPRDGELLLTQVPLRLPQGKQAQVQAQGRRRGRAPQVSAEISNSNVMLFLDNLFALNATTIAECDIG